MAMIQPIVGNTEPWWPDDPTPLADPPARYDRFADELVARFHDWSATPVATSFLADERFGYVGVIEELDGGRVVGIQTDAFEIAGVRDHPHWAALPRPQPPSEVIGPVASTGSLA